ncbi:hypothetical protein BGZ98_000483, partial [Dissophora globulifera]
ALLQATLNQSRHAWTHSAFTRFIPEPPVRGPGGKKYASELTPLGYCTVCIGPHIFVDTRFYAVFNPTPPTPPLPTSTSGTASNPTVTTSNDETALSPSPSPPIVLGGSPAPERVIEIIMARTANMAAEAAAAGTVPETLAPSYMDIDATPIHVKMAGVSSFDIHNRIMASHHAASNDSTQNSDPSASAVAGDMISEPTAVKSEPTEKQSSSLRSSTPVSAGSKIKAATPRAHGPKHQIAFEFKENPGVRWLFPHESSLDLTPADGDEPSKISASFYLPTMEEARSNHSGAGSGAGAALGLVPGPGQATTIVILEATPDLWARLQQSINDSAATYRFMMDKMKHIPPRVYVQYNLPVNFPDEQLHALGLKKLPDNKVVTLASLEPSKRTQDSMSEQQSVTKSKRPKAGQEEVSTAGTKGGTPSKKSTNTTTNLANSTHRKQCCYCGRTSTPLWRRGPDGTHNLCNACGVKWRKKQISFDSSSSQSSTSPSETSSQLSTAPSSSSGTLTTTAEAAVRMRRGTLRTRSQESSRAGHDDQHMEVIVSETKAAKRTSLALRKQDSFASVEGPMDRDLEGSSGEVDDIEHAKKLSTGKVSLATSGPKLVPIHQLGEGAKQSVRAGAGSRKDKEKEKAAVPSRLGRTEGGSSSRSNGSDDSTRASSISPSPASVPTLPLDSTIALASASASNPALISASASASSFAPVTTSASSGPSTSKISASKITATKASTATPKASRTKGSASESTTPPTTKPSPPTTAAAKLSLLKSLANAPRYQVSHPATAATVSLADDGLSLYAAKNLYTNNTATFPLHFPTISIAFGPNNAYYTYPNCAVVLFENHFQIKLIHAGERTDIDVRKEAIENTEFQVVDVGDGESMIVMKAMLRQHLARFEKELLNADKNEILIVFRFRERLDGGGPPVKPLLEQWLTTEIPVAPPKDKAPNIK